METKPSYLSKTLWLNLIVAGLSLFAPGAAQFISEHPTEVMVGFTVVNLLLRLVTKGKIELY